MSNLDSMYRNPNYNVEANAIKNFQKETILRIYEKIYRARAFDLCVIDAVNDKKVIAPVYLSLGQEAVAAALSEKYSYDWIFSQHRAHDLYVSIGGDLKEFRDELLGLPTGFSGGRAGSSCLRYMKNGRKLVGHHGLIGENVPQAVGAALATSERTICIFGDGSAEEDYVLESIGFAATRKLPILFICLDNDLSILTKTEERRKWELVSVANGFGVKGIDLSDCPWTILKHLDEWNEQEPLLINCRVCRERWHSGIGIDGAREWERNAIVREQIVQLGYSEEVVKLETMIDEEMEKLWKN